MPGMGGLGESPHASFDIPPELQARISAVGAKPRQAEGLSQSWHSAPCGHTPSPSCARCWSGKDTKELRRTDLRPLRQDARLALKYPED